MKRHIAVLALLTVASYAAASGPGVKLKMADPVQRHDVRVASHNGVVTLAASARMGSYGKRDDLRDGLVGETVRIACGKVPAKSRLMCPECVVVQEYDAFRVVDVHRRADLYKPGVNRDRALNELKRHDTTRQKRLKQASTFTDVRLMQKFVWEDYVTISYLVDGKNSDRPVSVEIDELRYDAQSDKYWMMSHNTLTGEIPEMTSNAILNAWQSNDLEAMRPFNHDGMTALRVLVDHSGRQLAPRKFVFKEIDASDPSAIGKNDVILYVRMNTPAWRGTPLVDVDPQSLDKSAQAMRKALALYLQIAAEKAPYDQISSVWHPGESVALKWQSKHDKRMVDMMSSRLKRAVDRGDMTPQEIKKVTKNNKQYIIEFLQNAESRISDVSVDIPRLRFVARVFVDDGVVWYGWLPAGEYKKSIGKADSITIVTLFQRLVDGDYKLCTELTEPKKVARHPAFMFLNDRDLASFFVHRELP